MKEIPLPKRIKRLPRDSKGRPIPQFVAKPSNGGDPDFRIADPYAIERCYVDDLCWVCGEKMGVYKCFTLGPMCCLNRVNSEPPSHYECAHYSVQACPFLSTPKMHRREGDMLNVDPPAGLPIYENPGSVAIWVTKSYEPFKDGMGGIMFSLGAPERVEWYCQGRMATRNEVDASIAARFPVLQAAAKEDGPKAIVQLEKMRLDLIPLLPA